MVKKVRVQAVAAIAASRERFDNEEFYAMYEQAYAELYEQLIASGYAEETLNELTTRAEEAGDEGAAELAESIGVSVASLSETAPEPSAGMGRVEE